MKTGTLSSILKDVADNLGMTATELAATLFRK